LASFVGPLAYNTYTHIVETVSFFISVLIVTYVVQDGKANYLEGAMLIGLYVIIALAFYATPSDALNNMLASLS
jgi:Ca2+:H+ antiporter